MTLKDKKPLKYHIGKAHYFQDNTEVVEVFWLAQAIKELKEAIDYHFLGICDERLFALKKVIKDKIFGDFEENKQ